MRQELNYKVHDVRERFKDIFDYSLDLIYAHDLRGNFLDANDLALATLGFTREEIPNISLSKLIDNNQLEKVFNVLKELKEFGRQKEPSEYKLKDRYGNTIYLETYGIPLKTNGQIFGILGIAKDITTKKKTELQLKQAKQDLEQINLELENKVRKKTQKLEKSVQNLKFSEEKYRNLIETSTMGFLEINLESGQVEYINPKFLEIIGYERQELENETFFYKILYPEDFRALTKSHDNRKTEFRIMSKDKEIKWLSGTRTFQYDSIGQPKKLELWVQEITENKIMEQKLRDSELNFRTITEQSLIGIQILQENRTKYINQQWSEISGYSVEEILKWNLEEHLKFIHPDDRELVRQQLTKKQKGDHDVLNHYQVKCIKKSGETIWVEIFATSITYNGKFADLAMIIDITEAKLTQQKLKESEEKFKVIAEQSPMELIIIQDNKVKYANPQSANITGIPVSEISKWNIKRIFENIHPDDLNLFRENVRKTLNNSPDALKHLEYRVINDTGEILWVASHGMQIHFEGKPAHVIASIDITNRKTLEHQLKESEEKYRLIIESISDPLHVVNTDLKIIYLNPAFTNWLKALGLNHEVIGKNPTEAFPFIEKNVIKEYQEIFKSKKELFLESYSVLNNKRIFTETKKIPVLNEGKVIQIITIVRDVSERKEIDLKLRESEEKYRSILENINEGYFEVDLKGNFTFFNNALCLNTGYSREELLNKSYSKLFDDKRAKEVYRMYHELYQRGKGSILFDYQVIRKDGSKFYHESSTYLRNDSNGNIIGFKGFIRDISEKKKIDNLKERFSQELEKEVELKTKELKVAFNQQRLYLDKILKASHFQTEFMARISHELRTPLNAIIGFTDLLLEGVYGQLNAEQLEFVKDIEESSKDLLDMISNILDISKIESGQVILKIEKTEIYDIIQQVISALNPLYNEKDLKFKLKGLNKNQVIIIDRIKFKQIIFNLLSNAIKFTEKGTILVEFLDKKDNWEFNVKDTGVGIAKKDFNIIFKEFKRVRTTYVNSKPGSGLGLALTKRLVNLHGGNISFISELGKGSTFTFFIPKNPETLSNTINVSEFLDLL